MGVLYLYKYNTQAKNHLEKGCASNQVTILSRTPAERKRLGRTGWRMTLLAGGHSMLRNTPRPVCNTLVTGLQQEHPSKSPVNGHYLEIRPQFRPMFMPL
jgi:hypothetical protein